MDEKLRFRGLMRPKPEKVIKATKYHVGFDPVAYYYTPDEWQKKKLKEKEQNHGSRKN